MKVTFRVNLTSSTGRTGTQRVSTTLAELESDEKGTKAEMGRLAADELTSRDRRNGKPDTWAATSTERA
jgi:hypothetical protein